MGVAVVVAVGAAGVGPNHDVDHVTCPIGRRQDEDSDRL